MRALYDYDPSEDTLLPCREIGLEFKSGDVLQIVDQRDPNWWQARLADGEPDRPVGLVPSLELEERRKAFVAPEADYVHKIGICGEFSTILSKILSLFIFYISVLFLFLKPHLKILQLILCLSSMSPVLCNAIILTFVSFFRRTFPFFITNSLHVLFESSNIPDNFFPFLVKMFYPLTRIFLRFCVCREKPSHFFNCLV